MSIIIQRDLFGDEVYNVTSSIGGLVQCNDDDGFHRIKTDVANDILFQNVSHTGMYDIPLLDRCDYRRNVMPSAISFSKALSSRKQTGGILHFFEDDYKFARIFKNPMRYLALLKRHMYVVMPDFSLLIGMARALQIYNVYRNYLLANWMQRNGVRVVPLACWSDASSFDWCFSGLPSGGTIAVSMAGAMGSDLSKLAFWRGLKELFARKKPDMVWLFGLHHNAEVEEYIASTCDVEFINTNYHG